MEILITKAVGCPDDAMILITGDLPAEMDMVDAVDGCILEAAQLGDVLLARLPEATMDHLLVYLLNQKASERLTSYVWRGKDGATCQQNPS